MGEDKYTVRVTQYTGAGNALDQVLGADPHRIALLVSNVNTVANVQVAATSWPGGNATFVLAQGSPLDFKYKDSGPFCAGAWAAVNVMVGVRIDWVEILLVAR